MITKILYPKKSQTWLLLLAAIFTIGLALRVIQIGTTPFENGDDVSTAWATTWYFPRDWSRMFRLGQGITEPNPIGIITLGHGPLQVTIAYIWVKIVDFIGLQITEMVWHIIFAILGSLTIPLIYLLGATLQNRRAGLMAALFASVIPLHVAFSRTSGESHFILSTLLQIITILNWLKYSETKQKKFALATGLAVGMDMLTDFAFIGLIITLIFISFITNFSASHNISVKGVISDICQWELIIFILPSIAIHAYTIIQALFSNQYVGMFGRVFSEGQSDQTILGGFFLIPAIKNLIYTTNIPTIFILGVCLVAFIFVKKARTKGSFIALFWAIIYIFPFLFLFERSRLVGHFIPVIVAFCLFIAFILERFLESRPFIIILISGFAYLSLFLSALSTVFGVSTIGILNHPTDHGRVGVDRGTKAAAYWVRQNTPVDTLLFTDPYAQQSLSLSMYYYHRPVVSMELDARSSIEKSIQLIEDNLSIIDVIIIGTEHINLIPTEIKDQFQTAGKVLVDGKVSLYILTKRANNISYNDEDGPIILDSTIYNSLYDELYSNLPEIIALPFKEIQTYKSIIKTD